MTARPDAPRADMKPAWRAACLAYRAKRGEGAWDHLAHLAARDAVLELHPELTPKQASQEAVNAVAYAAAWHSEWFWVPLKKHWLRRRPARAYPTRRDRRT